MIVTVHDGKGQKDRTVPIPETIIPELKLHVMTSPKFELTDTDRTACSIGVCQRVAGGEAGGP
jgi:hypothetical protein